MRDADNKAEEVDPEFRPGLYKHYKGNAYVAVCLVTHHETRRPMVLYVSLIYGSVNVRPLRGWEGDPDGFLDPIPIYHDGVDTGLTVPRFQYIGPVPSDTPALGRV